MASLDSSLQGRLQRLLSELQRRKVIRVAAAYVVAGWIILQVAASLENALTLPAWFDTVVLSFLIVGFPVALIASWIFEFTPEGIKRTVGSGDGALMWPHTSDWILTGMLVVVLGVVVSQMLMPRSSETSSVPERSIAVLPFENLSSDKDNAYFAVGIQDEILTRLTKIGALKVISRTSTAHFASSPDNLPEIAKQLGVAYILEGSVQREKDAVRITVQLINAATDGHLWAEIYERKLDDVFRVQSEIATAIAEALNAKVTGSEKRALAVAPTNNPAAYDLYLRGLAFYRRFDGPNTRSAEQFLNQAVRLDPDFATAWALLAKIHAVLFHFGDDQSDARRTAARAALDTALRLQPKLVEVLLAQGYYQYWVERDFPGARQGFEQVYAKWPNNADAVVALGLIARRQGRWDQAKAYLNQAVTLDPLSQGLRYEQVGVHMSTRDFSVAQRRIDEALNIWPDDLRLIGSKATVYQLLGQLDQADELLKPLHPRPEDATVGAIVNMAKFRRRYGEAISMLEGLLASDQATGSVGLRSSDLNLYLGDLRRLSNDAAGAKVNYILVRDELLPELKRQPRNAGLLSTLAYVYCGLGERELAMGYADRAVKLVPVAKDALDGAAWEETRAWIWACFGDRDRAIPAIARLLKLPGGWLTPAILRLDPDFDKLRGDPRFEALLIDDVKPSAGGDSSSQR